MKMVFNRMRLIAAGIVFCSSIFSASYNSQAEDGCDFALNALASCQQADTGQCVGGGQCRTAGTSGTIYSQNLVYTTTSGGSLSDGTANVDCSKPRTCTTNPHPGKRCDPWGASSCINDDSNICHTYTETIGNYVPVPSAKIKACPG